MPTVNKSQTPALLRPPAVELLLGKRVVMPVAPTTSVVDWPWQKAIQMMPTPQSQAMIRTSIPFRLDWSPWSRFHLLVVIGLGITWILDGLEVTIVGSLGPTLQSPDTLHLSSSNLGAIASLTPASTECPLRADSVEKDFLTDEQFFSDRWCVVHAATWGTTSLHTKPTADRRIGPTGGCSGGDYQNSIFARFFGLLDFRLLQHYLPIAAVHQHYALTGWRFR
jgi:hypothetical protein